MKKKLLTLLTLLVMFVTGAWAQDPTLSIGATAQTTSTFLGEYATEGITLSSSADYSSGAVQIGNTPSSYDQHYFEVLASNAPIEKVSFLISGNGSNKSIQAPVFGWATTATSNTADTYRILDAVTVTANSYAAAQWFTYDFSESDVKCLRIYRTTKYVSSINPEYTGSSTALGSGQTIKIYGIKVWLKPAAPKITAQPVGGNYVQGSTATALSVTASAVSGGTLSYQWYSNTTESTENASAIDGATNSTYTPSTTTLGTTYYYCVVSEYGVAKTATSDIVAVTVSSATAPTITVSGAPATSVVKGTEITLTATMTGVPSPTIQWYRNATASTTGGTAIDGETSDTYTPSTATTGTFYYYAIATNSQGSATSAVQTITVKEQVATPTFDPNGAYFQDSQEVTLACTTAGATIKYSTDDGATWTDYTAALTFDATTTVQAKAIRDGYIDSEVATATFTKVTLDEQTDVTGAMTWDWSKFGTSTIQLTDATTPKKTDEFVLSNVFAYGLTSAAVPAAFGDAQALKVTCEYPVRDGKYLQGGYIKFNTTVAGTLEVTYSNTGNRSEENDRRFLNVNGVNYGDGTMSSKTTVTTEVPAVAAGEVVIKGTLKGDGSDQYLRIYKIVFTPITNVSATISTTGWSTYCSPVALDFSSVSDLEAYIATGVEGTMVTTSALEGSVPANTPLLLKGIAEAEYTIPVVASSTTDVTANKLVAGTGAAVAKEDGVTRYVLSANEGKAVFKMIDTTPATVPVGKAYLEIEISGNPPAPMLSFDLGGDTTGISNVNVNHNDNQWYDLSGRRIENPTKGVYIMNGRKVVIK